MLGHQDVAVEFKAVGPAGVFEKPFEEDVVRGERGFAVVGAEGKEVEVACVVIPDQAVGQGRSVGSSLARAYPTFGTIVLCRRWGTRSVGGEDAWLLATVFVPGPPAHPPHPPA